MKKDDDLSPQHLKWLVDNRSKNQQTSLLLFNLLEKHRETIESQHLMYNIAQGLVAAAFSLWRAVFLSDKTHEEGRKIEDARAFLGKMIVDNAITYSQDRMTRDWTFDYYVNNARYRLEAIHVLLPSILDKEKIVKKRRKAKANWEYYQEALNHAVEGFALELEKKK